MIRTIYLHYNSLAKKKKQRHYCNIHVIYKLKRQQ